MSTLSHISFCSYCGKVKPQLQFLRRSIKRISIYRRLSSTKVKLQQRPKWKPVIGLEVHAQIQAESKLFSSASPKFGGPVNSQVAFLDTALPGTLPVLNKRCVEAGVITALALGCTVNKISMFDRKHYFYADLPAGYQITQQRKALANNGSFMYMVYGRKQEDCVERVVRITQIQLEQDSGKSLHDEEEKRSLIDLNRAGTALMEIVTEPDFTSGEEAKAFIRELRQTLMILGTCDGKMSEGSLRVDANISVHQPDEPLGVRSEVKNLNSANSIRKAIDFEIQRQIKVLEEGGEVVNETRSFDVDTGETLPMRDKEVKQDYRFLPEPNLPPLHIHTTETAPTTTNSVVLLDKLQERLPTLPRALREYVINKYGLTMYRAALIVNEGLLEHFEKLIDGRDLHSFSTFLIHQFLDPLQMRDIEVSESGVPAEKIGQLYDWYKSDNLSLINIEKMMASLISDPDIDLKTLADTEDFWQINDEEYLTEICQKIISQEQKSVRKYKRGNKRALNRLMGQARLATRDKGNPVRMSQIFKRLMSE